MMTGNPVPTVLRLSKAFLSTDVERGLLNLAGHYPVCCPKRCLTTNYQQRSLRVQLILDGAIHRQQNKHPFLIVGKLPRRHGISRTTQNGNLQTSCHSI